MEHYYKEVAKLDLNVHDFYRYFEVPDLQHCSFCRLSCLGGGWHRSGIATSQPDRPRWDVH